MKWVKGHIYSYSIELDEHPQHPRGGRSARYYAKDRGTYNYSSLDMCFLLIDYHEYCDSIILGEIQIFVINQDGKGNLYKEWKEIHTEWFNLDTHIGFEDITNKYSTKDLYMFNKLSKVLRG